MVIYVGREGVLRTNHLNEELARLKDLCVDLEWLRVGVLPSFEDLEDAPLHRRLFIRPAWRGRASGEGHGPSPSRGDDSRDVGPLRVRSRPRLG